MATLYTRQSSNVRKTWFLVAGFLVFIILLGWGASWYFSSSMILYGAVAFALIMNLFSFWYSKNVALRVSGAKEAPEAEYPELHNITENLAITAGLPKPEIYVIEDDVPNAFATGRNPEDAAVAVTTGLLQRLERSELEGVMAHELSHIGNRDILLSTIIVVLVGFVTLLSDFFIRISIFGGSDNRGGRIGLIITVIGIVLAILSPLIATVIKLAISRKREFLADASGALLTRYPEGLANALRKIESAAQDKEMQRANHATAHLYIASPFGGSKGEQEGSFLTKLFRTHPPTSERIQALMDRQ